MKRMFGTAFAVLTLMVAGLAVGSQAQAKTVQATGNDVVSSDVAPNGATRTVYGDGRIEEMGPATAAGFRDSLSVGTPHWTGAYKRVVSGPHSTLVKVYVRSVHACYAESGYVNQACLGGSITYAAGFAACFNSCTVGGQRGTLSCLTSGSDSTTGSITLVRCYSALIKYGTASKAVEIDNSCIGAGPFSVCDGVAWHVNAYPTGNVTGPYGGEGIVY